jgi:hypothetical protein
MEKPNAGKSRIKRYIKMNKIKKAFLHFPKAMAYAELGSQRQVQRISTDWGESFAELTDKNKEQLKRSQFAFGSSFPYTFDGMANRATHFGKEGLKSHDYYYSLELPIDELCDLSLMDFKLHSRRYFLHELLKRGKISDKDEGKHLRCIPIANGDYISAQPLIIGFRQRTQEEIYPKKLRSLQNLRGFNEYTKVINTVFIYILKPLIEPIFEGYDGGWFSCPNALQAKIIHALFSAEKYPDLKAISKWLSPLLLRKSILYLNCKDGSQNADYMRLDAIDLWEHVSPSEIIVVNGKRYIRDWDSASAKINSINKFFTFMGEEGLMEGAKAFPCEPKEGHPKRIYHDKSKQEYIIFFKRSPEFLLRKSRKTKFFTHNS